MTAHIYIYSLLQYISKQACDCSLHRKIIAAFYAVHISKCPHMLIYPNLGVLLAYKHFLPQINHIPLFCVHTLARNILIDFIPP